MLSFSIRKSPQLRGCMGGGSAGIGTGREGEVTEVTNVSFGPGFSPSLAQTNILASLWVSASFLPSLSRVHTINVNLSCFLLCARRLGSSEDTEE